ncbi:trichohyalin-like isoform X2 [Gigantopelta aegis]|uniref:trichohyalin-like isoform X2 n=1 Tax=Gigantopelta aegis TaxID=1735272 RepID=UPI001B88CBBA|nr:trichohyalin-like isoform X2 [Gigantopelta aegis]
MTGRMDGMDADGEWSDDSDDGVKSGSATAVSENELEDDSPTKQHITIVTTTTLLHRDPVHAILDKIDAELGAIHMTKSSKGHLKAHPVSKKSVVSAANRLKLEAEGVMFDTGDEMDKDKLVVPATGSDRDTGLGTGSVLEETAQDGDHQKIVGTAQMYSDAAEITDDDLVHHADDHHSDLDSVAAQQIDEKFKEIMRKKRGGYLDGLKAPVAASDRTSIKTEDFEDKFKETLIGNRKCVAGPGDLPPHSKSTPHAGQSSVPKQRPSASFSSLRMSAGCGSDFGSVKTEEFETRFQELIVKQSSAGARQQPKPGKMTTAQKTLPAMPSSFSLSKSESSNGILGRSYKDSSNKKTKPVGSSPSEETSIKVRSLPSPLVQDRASSSSPRFHDNRTTSSVDGTSILRPRSVSPRLFRTEPNIVNVYEDESLKEQAREIERETEKIRKEMEKERQRSRSASPIHRPQSVPPKLLFSSFSERPTISKAEEDHLAERQETYSRTDDRESRLVRGALTQEVKILRQALHTTRMDQQQAEQTLKDTREKAENARTQLMLTEFKRTNAMKDLQRILSDVEKHRKQAENYMNQIRLKEDELQDIENLGISREEAKSLVEDNSNLKQKCRTLDGLELERDELVRQLQCTKEELFNEQKLARHRHEELQEEVETLLCKLDEVQESDDDVHKKLAATEDAFLRMEAEKDEIIQQKTRDYEVLRDQTRRELSDHELTSVQTRDQLQQEMSELRHTIGQLQDEINCREDTDIKLGNELIELQQELAKETDARDAISADHKRALTSLRKETDSAMLKLRESLFLEKQQTIEDLKVGFEQERREAASRVEDRIVALVSENTNIVAEKSREIERLQNLVKRLGDERRDLEVKMQDMITLQVREAVTKEREVLQTEKDWCIRREKENIAAELKQKINTLTVDLDRETKVKEGLLSQVQKLQQEVNDQRQQTRQLAKEKVFAVARAKDMVREQTSSEVERIKEKLKQDSLHEMDRLRESVRLLEEEVRVMRTDKVQMMRHQKECVAALERTERTVINEVNEECRRTAGLLGISPRRVQPGSHDSVCVSPDNSHPTNKYRTPITTALANLRACNEELRNHIHELKQEVESQKSLLLASQKEQRERIESMHDEMEREKNNELDTLKDRLLREHLAEVSRHEQTYGWDGDMAARLQDRENELRVMQQDARRWKEQTAQVLARQFEVELSRELKKQLSENNMAHREIQHINDRQQHDIERLERDVRKLAQSQGRALPQSVCRSPNTARNLSHPHTTRQHLQGDNSLQKSKLLNFSVPDLTKLSPYRPSSKDMSDLSGRVAGKPNEFLLSHKMNEMNTLETTLSNQTQELIKLEQAYSQLHQQYNQRASSPTRALNSTR